MPLPSPNLDDRDFAQLVEEAVSRVRQTCPSWTDLSPGDPGMVLLELFAHLTETMIYRINRLPEKAYYEFLNLMGVRLHPPSAAVTTLRFSRRDTGKGSIEIPAGTRVTVSRSDGGGDAPIFVTSERLTLTATEPSAEVLAHHCDWVEGELLGLGSGLAGLTLALRHPPIIAPTGDETDLVVGVEATPTELGERVPAREFAGKTYRIWQAVDSFASPGPDAFAYVADRYSGRIAFPPAARVVAVDGNLEDLPRALGEIPAAGREIRAWYRKGGGPAGNVAAGTLTMLKDPIPGVEVTNPGAAGGGRAAESVENALERGPQNLHSLERAVTARDFENCALRASGRVARARAITQAALWAHAPPGAVEVLLVPYLPEKQRGSGQVTAATIDAQRSEPVRELIQRDLESRRPLGVRCTVTWAQLKPVSVKARVVVRRQENRAAVQQRVLARLHGSINPLPTPYSLAGWRFGQSLRASHVYDAALAEPGVLWVDRVRLQVEKVPNSSVSALAVDAFQADTWYAASGDTLFRSLDNGEGWESVKHFPGEEVQLVRAHAGQAGLVAAVTQREGQQAYRLYVSRDCGESWDATPVTIAFEVNALDWTTREGTPLLLLATDVGLYELALTSGGSPVQVEVDPKNQGLGFYAVAVAHEVRGEVSVTVAARESGGVFLSHEGGQRGTFRNIGLQGNDIRLLAVQYDNVRSFLWAATYAANPEDEGDGCFRRELLGSQEPPEGWRPLNSGWQGGSCRALAFLGTRAVAASHRSGVLVLDAAEREPQWAAPDVRCGLPLRDPGRFQTVSALAATKTTVLAGMGEGVYRSQDGGVTYKPASAQEFSDRVTLPPTWLFCSGAHEIEVVSENEVERD